MKRPVTHIYSIVLGWLLVLVFTSCAVQRTPYPQTGYYRRTVERLDSLGPKINCSEDAIFAGFSKVSITPALNTKPENSYEGKFNKVPLAGFGNRKGKPATGVHDSLFVKAVALKMGSKLMVLVSADILLMPPNIVDSVLLILSGKGIKRDELFFSETHSHSSIGGWGYGFVSKQAAGKENKNLEKWLTRQISNAVINAISNLYPAKIGSGNFNASCFTRNRLIGNQGEKNGEFDYLIIEQTGRRKAVIGTYSAHATTLNENNMELSGDYPGYWERKTENGLADLAMFCGGSMGSQSPVGQGVQFDNAKYIGESLSDSLSVHLKNVSFSEKPVLCSVSLKIELPEFHFRVSTNMNLTTGVSRLLMAQPENVYLQALRINNLIWYFTPGDFSGEFALQIKNSLVEKGYEAAVTGYNGSYIGYIIPGKYFNLKSYEARLMGWFGPTMGDYTVDLINQICRLLILKK
jgi:neutral ceramidase